VTTEKEYSKLIDKETCPYDFPTWGTASTISFTGEHTGAVVLVSVGDTSDLEDEEVESILTHEAVHVKQFLFESIGEKTPGIETEAYTVQYFTDYLIREWHYRQSKKGKKK
jgi:hypothetical protein